MYSLLLYSFLISSILFGVIHYIGKNDREDPNEPYDIQKHLITTNNIIMFFMIFISCFVLVYFAFSDNTDILLSLGIYENDHKSINIQDPVYDVKKKNNIDPSILKRINDPLKYGFEPYSGGSEMSSSETSGESSSDSSSDDGSNSE